MTNFSNLTENTSEHINVLVVRVSTSTYMKGGSLCFTKSVTPLKRKSTIGISDMLTDIEVDTFYNLNEVYDGVYKVDVVNSLDEFGNVDDCEFYLVPYKGT